MKKIIKVLESDLLLILTSAIWGFAFVAQRLGMDHIGPYYFNGLRFLLGSASLIPFIMGKKLSKSTFTKGLMIGSVLFIAASLQQIGVIHTTAGNAGFITGVYVVIVPILGMFLKHKTNIFTWISSTLAVAGLYFLSGADGFHIQKGDLLVLTSALFWAIHVLMIDKVSKTENPAMLSIIQFSVCSILSLVTGFFTEQISLQMISGAMYPILYGGVMSVGVAYTLQMIAQKKVHPAHAAIILGSEGVFAMIGGMLILSEKISVNGLIGCGLILAGMMLSTVFRSSNEKQSKRTSTATKKCRQIEELQ